jgi:hypothetical protein
MNDNKRDAIIYLNSGQRKYGSIMGKEENGVFTFVSFIYEQLFGAEQAQLYIERIPVGDVKEIDLFMK